MLILSMCLLPVAIATFQLALQDLLVLRILGDAFFFIILFTCTATGSLSYAVRRIYWLLDQKDEELQERSRKMFDQGIDLYSQ